MATRLLFQCWSRSTWLTSPTLSFMLELVTPSVSLGSDLDSASYFCFCTPPSATLPELWPAWGHSDEPALSQGKRQQRLESQGELWRSTFSDKSLASYSSWVAWLSQQLTEEPNFSWKNSLDIRSTWTFSPTTAKYLEEYISTCISRVQWEPCNRTRFITLSLTFLKWNHSVVNIGEG